MMEIKTRLQIDLLPIECRQVDNILEQNYVTREFRNTRGKASQSRTRSRDEIIKKPPRFKFVSEYHASIYDSNTGLVYEGQWNDLHYWIAREHEVAKPEDSWNNIKMYTSCDVFCLRSNTQCKSLDIRYSLRFVETRSG